MCTIRSDCIGFMYNDSLSSCDLFGCFNPEKENEVESEERSLAYTRTVNHLLARGKGVTLSSVYQNTNLPTPYFGAFAVDGIYRPPADNEMVSIAHTTRETNPWLRVDLQKVHCIWAVRILNRGDNGASFMNQRLRDVTITASAKKEQLDDADLDTVCGSIAGVLNQYFTTITCVQPMRAQFVQLTIVGFQYLNIYEFEVHGFDAP
ncbi:fucolectin-1-like [Watersipora subatra]|uniref:fucolectin-1-like n=1 Tax=Watersipora subatra TaxID=2589382 RepID=UPI00355AF95A